MMFPEILDKVLEHLRDGEWHGINELQVKFKLGEHKARLIIEFLTNYGFCYQEYGTIMLKGNVRDFLDKLGEI